MNEQNENITLMKEATDGNANETIEEFLNELPDETQIEETPQEFTEQPPVEAPVETPQEFTEQPPVEVPVETPQEFTEQPPVEAPTETPQEFTEQPPVEVPAETPQEFTEQPPVEIPVETPQEFTEQPSMEAPVETPQEFTEQPPAEVPVETPQKSDPVLNRKEIETLLRIDDSEEPASIPKQKNKSSKTSNSNGDTKDVLMGMLNKTDISYERLPMLEVVFDRLVRLMSTSLRNFTSDNVEVHLEGISSIRFGDYLDDLTESSMIGVFKAEEWDNYGLFTVSSSLVYSIVDVLLGGRRGAPMNMENRPYTTIERSLVEKMLILVLNDLSVSFDPLSPVTFRFDRLETNSRFAVIVRPANLSILARFRVEMEDRGGTIELLLPYATLEPIREVLLQMFMGEKFGRDSIWEGHLATQLVQTNVTLEAVLEESEALLTDVLKWEIGSRVVFNATPETPITLRCNDVPMFSGSMGQKGGNIAVSINQNLGK